MFVRLGIRKASIRPHAYTCIVCLFIPWLRYDGKTGFSYSTSIQSLYGVP